MPASSRDMNMPVLITLFAIATILVYVIIVATQAWFQWEFNREWQTKVMNQPQDQLQLHTLRTEQEAELQNGPVPIRQAMDETIKAYANR